MTPSHLAHSAAVAGQWALWLRHDLPLESLLRLRKRRERDDASDAKPTARAENHKTTGGYGYVVAEGIAHFAVSGILVPVELVSWFYADEITVYDLLQRDVKAAAADQAVRGAMFHINSPGGFVDGAYQLAEAIAALSAAKPTASYGKAVVASAAYLQAAMTQRITAYKTTEVGSIGTRSAIYDYHRMFERVGIEAIALDSGGMKSAGLPGTPITDDQRDYFRGLVRKLNDFFVDAVAQGRRLTRQQAEQLADGRVHVAADAMSLGLIDAVGGLDEAMAELGRNATVKTPARRARTSNTGGADAAWSNEQPAAEAGPAKEPNRGADAEITAGAFAPEKGADMSQPNATAPTASQQAAEQPKPATVAELESACAGASSDFLLDCAKQGMTLPQAKDAFIGWQQAQIKTRDEELAKRAPAKPGAKVVAETTAAAGNLAPTAVEEFDAQVREQMKLGLSRSKAIAAVCRRDPELHRAFLEATNPSRHAREKIAEKFA